MYFIYADKWTSIYIALLDWQMKSEICRRVFLKGHILVKLSNIAAELPNVAIGYMKNGARENSKSCHFPSPTLLYRLLTS